MYVCACVYGLADTLFVELYFIVLIVELLVSTLILLLHFGFPVSSAQIWKGVNRNGYVRGGCLGVLDA